MSGETDTTYTADRAISGGGTDAEENALRDSARLSAEEIAAREVGIAINTFRTEGGSITESFRENHPAAASYLQTWLEDPTNEPANFQMDAEALIAASQQSTAAETTAATRSAAETPNHGPAHMINVPGVGDFAIRSTNGQPISGVRQDEIESYVTAMMTGSPQEQGQYFLTGAFTIAHAENANEPDNFVDSIEDLSAQRRLTQAVETSIQRGLESQRGINERLQQNPGLMLLMMLANWLNGNNTEQSQERQAENTVEQLANGFREVDQSQAAYTLEDLERASPVEQVGILGYAEHVFTEAGGEALTQEQRAEMLAEATARLTPEQMAYVNAAVVNTSGPDTIGSRITEQGARDVFNDRLNDELRSTMVEQSGMRIYVDGELVERDALEAALADVDRELEMRWQTPDGRNHELQLSDEELSRLAASQEDIGVALDNIAEFHIISSVENKGELHVSLLADLLADEAMPRDYAATHRPPGFNNDIRFEGTDDFLQQFNGRMNGGNASSRMPDSVIAALAAVEVADVQAAEVVATTDQDLEAERDASTGAITYPNEQLDAVFALDEQLDGSDRTLGETLAADLAVLDYTDLATFQAENGLKPTGIADEVTLAVLDVMRGGQSDIMSTVIERNEQLESPEIAVEGLEELRSGVADLDANNDGVLQAEEVAAAPETFAGVIPTIQDIGEALNIPSDVRGMIAEMNLSFGGQATNVAAGQEVAAVGGGITDEARLSQGAGVSTA